MKYKEKRLEYARQYKKAADYVKMMNYLSLAQEGVIYVKNGFFSKIMLLSTMHQ